MNRTIVTEPQEQVHLKNKLKQSISKQKKEFFQKRKATLKI